MKNRSEAAALAKHISAFLGDYVPSQKSGSANTLKAYQDSIGLYLQDVYKRQHYIGRVRHRIIRDIRL